LAALFTTKRFIYIQRIGQYGKICNAPYKVKHPNNKKCSTKQATLGNGAGLFCSSAAHMVQSDQINRKISSVPVKK